MLTCSYSPAAATAAAPPTYLPTPLPQLLQAHIVPSAAVKSTELKDGQKAELKTLEGGSINVYAKDGKVKVRVGPAPGTEVSTHSMMLCAL